MSCRVAGLTLIAALLFVSMAQAITLVKDGRPVASIVVRQTALDAQPGKIYDAGTLGTQEQKLKRAVDDLQHYVEKISGARLAVAGDAAEVKGPVILVGLSKKSEAFKDKIPSGLTPEHREEGFVILCKGDTLLLAGNDEGPYNGTFYAVAEFLNQLGVRWYMPGEFGEVVPRRATIEFADVEFRDKPDFLVRGWGAGSNLAPEIREEEMIWELRNKLTPNFAEIIAIPADASLQSYMPGKDMVKTHPEYFARAADGTLDPEMVNLGNPEVAKIVADNVKARIAEARKKDPGFNSLGFAPYDGAPDDFNKETMALHQGFADISGRQISEEWFVFMNRVTEDVVKAYPGFIITTNGYANRTTPPEGVKIHPNMGVMFAAIWSDQLHAYDDPKSWQAVAHGQMLKRWSEMCRRVFIYGYNETMLVTGLTPVPVGRRLVRNVPLIKDWGIIGFEDETSYCWMTHGITTYYLRAKLYWHAREDAKALLSDYFEAWYGPAAKPSRAYWEALEEAIESTPLLAHEDRVLPWVYSDKLIADLEKSESEAEKVAQAEPYKTRVHVDRLILEHLKGYMAMNRAEFVGNYAEALKQAEYMLRQRDQLSKISQFFYTPESKEPGRRYFAANTCYYNLTYRKEMHQKYLDMTTGKTGTLIAMAPREVKFSLDNAEMGRVGRWYDPGFDRSQWRTIDTATPYYLQGDNMYDKRGVPYAGMMWYVFEVDVPQAAIGNPIHLFAPIVVAEAWVWTNGQYSGRRPAIEPYERARASMELDVTDHVKAGKNVIGVRVDTGQSRANAAEGFDGPLFLYSPIEAEAAPAK